MRLSFAKLHGLITRYCRAPNPADALELRAELHAVEAALERRECDRDVNVIRTKSGWLPLGEAYLQKARGQFMFMMVPRAENRANASRASAEDRKVWTERRGLRALAKECGVLP